MTKKTFEATFQLLVRLSKPNRMIPYSETREGLVSFFTSFTRSKQIPLPFTRLKSGLTKKTDNARENHKSHQKMAETSAVRVIFELKMAKFVFGQTRESTFFGTGGSSETPFSSDLPFHPTLRPGEGMRGKFCLSRRVLQKRFLSSPLVKDHAAVNICEGRGGGTPSWHF